MPKNSFSDIQKSSDCLGEACPRTPYFMYYMYSHTKVLHFFIAVSSILIPRVHALECRTMVEM